MRSQIMDVLTSGPEAAPGPPRHPSQADSGGAGSAQLICNVDSGCEDGGEEQLNETCFCEPQRYTRPSR